MGITARIDLTQVYRPHFSYYFLWIFIIEWTAAITVLSFTPLPGFIYWILTIFMAVYGKYIISRHLTFSHPKSILEFYQENGYWKLRTKSGLLLTAKLKSSSVMTRYFVVLRFQVIGQKTCLFVCLFPDSLPSDKLRWLRYLSNSCATC